MTAPLTFGQLSTWRSIGTFAADRLAEVNVPGTIDLRGHSAAAVREGLAQLVARHESLRTTYSADLRQHVHDEVEPPIEHLDLADVDAAAPTRYTTAAMRRPFPVTGDLGWRGTLVSAGGRPVFLALAASHLAV